MLSDRLYSLKDLRLKHHCDFRYPPFLWESTSRVRRSSRYLKKKQKDCTSFCSSIYFCHICLLFFWKKNGLFIFFVLILLVFITSVFKADFIVFRCIVRSVFQGDFIVFYCIVRSLTTKTFGGDEQGDEPYYITCAVRGPFELDSITGGSCPNPRRYNAYNSLSSDNAVCYMGGSNAVTSKLAWTPSPKIYSNDTSSYLRLTFETPISTASDSYDIEYSLISMSEDCVKEQYGLSSANQSSAILSIFDLALNPVYDSSMRIKAYDIMSLWSSDDLAIANASWSNRTVLLNRQE